MSFRKAVVRFCFGSAFLGMMLFLVQCSSKECYYSTDCPDKKICNQTSGQCVIDLVQDNCNSDTECKEGKKCVKGKCVLLPSGYEFPDPNAEPKPEPKPEEPKPEDAGPPEEGPEPDKGPQSCSNNVTCSSISGSVCAYDEASEGLKCLPENKGGKKLGEACNPAAAAPGDCASRTCHPIRKVCTRHCAKEADCSSGVCESVKIGKGTFSVCLASDNECNRDKDCSAASTNSNLCVLQEQGGVKVVTRCGPAIGQGEVGASCFGDGDCKHNYCINKDYCSMFCVSDSDCGQGFKCEVEEIARFGKKFSFKLCKYPKEGLPCTSDKECRRNGYICIPTKVGTKIELRCQNPPGSGYATGCKIGSDCRSGVCLPNSGLKCSKPCVNDVDCTRTGGAAKCANVIVEVNKVRQSLKMCVLLYKACTQTSDCKKDLEVCSPHIDDSGAFSLRCLDNNPLALPLGSDCTANDNCQSRICHNSRCSALCKFSADCGKKIQGFNCSNEDITFSGKPSIKTTLCTVPSSGLGCDGQQDANKEAKCPSKTSNVCRIVEQGGALDRRCRPKLATGSKKVGELCSKDGDCETGSCLLPDGVCTYPCTDDKECTTNNSDLRCLPMASDSNISGKKATFNICTYRHCKGDTDCDKGRICRYIKNGATGFLGCVLPDSKKLAAGAACDPSKNGADCRSDFCHPTQKVCASPCRGGDNEKCPLQFNCELQASGKAQTHLCLPLAKGCLQNSTCSQGELCVYSVDANKRPQQTCGSALGARKLGEFCDPTAKSPQCQTGFCDPKTKRCSQFCSLASHCPQDSYRCTTVTVAINSKNYDLQACRSVLCRHNGDCLSGEVCQVSFVPGVGPVKKCGAVGTKKAVGQTCSLGTDCQTGLCGKSGGNTVCLALCSAHRHCKDSERCDGVAFISNSRTDACLKGARTTCSGDKDCPNLQICQVNFAGNNPVAQCQTKKVGELEAGKGCNPLDGFPGKCASHLCDPVTKKCLSVCSPGLSDCPTGDICDTFNILNKPVNACIPPPKVCTKASDCVSGTVCGVSLVKSVVNYFCLRTGPSQPKKLGEACNPGKAFPGECQTGLCHPDLKVCVNTCSADTDCKEASRPLCGKIELSNGLLARACIPKGALCNRDVECPSSEPVCALEISNNILLRKCSRGSTFGSKKIGESCDFEKRLTQSECSNRFCEAGRQICTAVCSKNSHCPKGMVCGETFVEGTRKLFGCIPPVGSSCKQAKDCAVPSTCRAQLETTGVIAKCRNINGKGLGLTCAPNGKITNECKSGICHPNTKQCTSVCEKDSDCGLGRCKEITLEGFKTKVCNTSCSKDSDCPTGQICGANNVGGTLSLSCILPDKQKKAAGGACSPGKEVRVSDCQSAVCRQVDSKCSSVCDKDSDCSTGQICANSFVLVNQTFAAVKVCVPGTGSCRRADHCKNNTLCQLESRSGKLNLTCNAPDLKRKPEGNACTSTAFPGDCRTGLCDPKSKQCTITCTQDADCKAPRNKCATITVGTATVSACVQP